jgi:hypothetical protein
MSPRKLVASLLGVMVVACGGVFTGGDRSDGQAPVDRAAASPTAAMDRLPVADSSGLDRPLQAYTLLLPRGWTSEGDVTWHPEEHCFVASVRQRVTSTSPDQLWRFDTLPAEEWDWPEDAKTQAMLQKNPRSSWACPIAPPLDAAAFLAGPMAREMGGEVTAVDVPARTLSSLQQQLLKAANEPHGKARMPVQSVSAAVGTVRFPDGTAGVALAGVLTTISTIPGPTKGSEIRVVASQAMRKYVLRLPAGHDADGRELLDATAASVEINPEWIAAVRQKTARPAAGSARVASGRTSSHRTQATSRQPNAQGQKPARGKPWAFVQKLTGSGHGQQTMQGQQAMQEAQQYSADLQQQTWEAQQASQDRMFKAADQTIRDVESWEDPTTGNEVELQYGYNNAWSDGSGTYVQSTDVTFDPNAQLDAGSWQALEKPADEE